MGSFRDLQSLFFVLKIFITFIIRKNIQEMLSMLQLKILRLLSCSSAAINDILQTLSNLTKYFVSKVSEFWNKNEEFIIHYFPISIYKFEFLIVRLHFIIIITIFDVFMKITINDWIDTST